VEIELANQQRDIKITEWFGQYGRRVLAFVGSRIRDLEVAEDTAQDVWLQLTRQEDLAEIEQIGNWLFTTARNRVTDYYRKKKTVSFSQMALENSSESVEESEMADDLLLDHWLDHNLPDAKWVAKGIGWYRWSHLSNAEKADKITEKISRHLDLTDEKKGQVYALNLEKGQSMEAAHRSIQHNHEVWKQLREDWKNEVRDILTQEQQKNSGAECLDGVGTMWLL
jgi:DNA-directed RNA polymerase specialized sigma24 family protein